jgi:hypothetical protein
MLLKNELKGEILVVELEELDELDELVELLRCWLVGCLIEEWMEFDNKMLLIKRNI